MYLTIRKTKITKRRAISNISRRKILFVILMIVLSSCNNNRSSSSACNLSDSTCFSSEDINDIGDINNTRSLKLISIEEFIECADKEIVLIGSDGCRFCLLMKEVLEQIQSENRKEVLYLNVDYVNDINEFIKTLSLMSGRKENDFDHISIPMLLIVKNGKIVDQLIGIVEYANIEPDIAKIWTKERIILFLKKYD